MDSNFHKTHQTPYYHSRISTCIDDHEAATLRMKTIFEILSISDSEFIWSANIILFSRSQLSCRSNPNNFEKLTNSKKSLNALWLLKNINHCNLWFIKNDSSIQNNQEWFSMNRICVARFALLYKILFFQIKSIFQILLFYVSRLNGVKWTCRRK